MALVSRSTNKIFTLAELKTFLRVSHSDEDTFLDGLIFDAMQFVETVTGEAVCELTALDYFTEVTKEIKTSYVNAKEITLVEYLNASNSWVTLSSSLYSLLPDKKPSVIVFKIDDESFPTLIEEEKQKLRITYKAGLLAGEENATLFKRVCYIFCGHFYEHRQALEVPKFLHEFLMVDRKQNVF